VTSLRRPAGTTGRRGRGARDGSRRARSRDRERPVADPSETLAGGACAPARRLLQFTAREPSSPRQAEPAESREEVRRCLSLSLPRSSRASSVRTASRARAWAP